MTGQVRIWGALLAVGVTLTSCVDRTTYPFPKRGETASSTAAESSSDSGTAGGSSADVATDAETGATDTSGGTG